MPRNAAARRAWLAIFHAATRLAAPAVAALQVRVRRSLLRSFVRRRGLRPRDDTRAMAQWQHGGGFSVDGLVRIEVTDRAERERLLRYCAPPFALARLYERDPEYPLYASTKPGPGGNAPRLLIPLEMLDRITPWYRHCGSIATATSARRRE